MIGYGGGCVCVCVCVCVGGGGLRVIKLFVLCLESKVQNWASSRENLSSGFPTNLVSNQSLQLQRLARQLKFRS